MLVIKLAIKDSQYQQYSIPNGFLFCKKMVVIGVVKVGTGETNTREQDLGDGRVNEMIGTVLGLGFIVYPLLWVYFYFAYLILKKSSPGLAAFFACIYLVFFWYLQATIWPLFERFIQPKKIYRLWADLDFGWNSMPERPKQQVTTYRVRENDITTSSEKCLLWFYGQIELWPLMVGFYLFAVVRS